MTSVESSENIEARLNDFIKDSQSLAPGLPANHQDPLIILYGQTHLGVPLHHIKLREIEAGREAPEFKACEVLLRGTLQGHVLFQTTIHNSNLKDCILIACTIYGGRIETSQLTDCRIRKKAFGEHDTSLTTPFMSCCNIDGGNAYDTEIFNSTANRVGPIQSCVIESSLAIYSLGFDSTLSSCGVYESKLHNCEVIGGIKNSVIESKNTLNFRRFPGEIRKMIFLNAIEIDGLTTGLIAALRPDSLLYSEVLETFYQEYIFVLSDENQEVFKSVSKTSLQRLTKIYLKGINVVPTSDASMYFPIGTKITSITMEFQGRLVDIHHFYDITKVWFKYFGTVLNFTVVWKDSKPWKEGDFRVPPDPPEVLKTAIRVANKWLKIESVFVKGKSQEKKRINTGHSNLGMFRKPRVILGPELETFTWTWLAQKGSVLTWNSS
ncbi:hypothetical protein LARI1_G006509 [Lachnellula arida]|uniref:Uncharacterized protein n=1 Tax=Lachnellula arida TaxID=1316785 RepID=A0A8T9BEQ5_9HELO|nr:hypothetical protein LARI1_G006509 [Lachnellula arida]